MLRRGRYCLAMHRIGSLPAICVLALAVALGACSDDSGPTPPEDAEVPAAIQALIDELFPEGNLRDSATSQVAEVLASVSHGEIGLAAVMFVTLTAGSIYVLYQNLFATKAQKVEHASYVF